jgi:hypothetical protein
MGAEVVRRLTYEEFRQLPDDGKRYELIRGGGAFDPIPQYKTPVCSP